MPRKTRMNNITSPELLSQVNPENIRLMNDFLEYLRSVQRSETTIAAYKNDLEIAWVWCLQNNNNAFFVNWTKRNIVAYQGWLLNNNENSPARIRRLKASLSSISNYIENVLDDEYPGFRNIINKVESPANRMVRQKTVWEDSELEDLLRKLTEKKKYAKACFVALGMFSGRRKAELARFKVSDFDDSHLVCDGALYKSDPILTKGNKYLECYTLAKKFKPYFDNWMAYRKENGIESPWLFPDTDNPDEHVQISMFNSWANSLSRITGRDFYTHSLRHYFVSALSRAGIPDNVVVQIIGWSSAEMFNVYNDNSKEDMIGMYFKDGEIATDSKRDLSDI